MIRLNLRVFIPNDSMMECYNATMVMHECMNEGMREIEDSAELMLEYFEIRRSLFDIRNSFLLMMY